MNFVDYLFENSKELNKNLILNKKDEIDYPTLHSNVLKLAAFIREKVGQDNPIVLISPNNQYFVLCYLAIIKSGNIVVPLNPNLEIANYNEIIATAEVHYGFIHSSLNRFGNAILTFCDFDVASVLHEFASELDVEPDFDSNRLSEYIFTSGSTALPKGVMLSSKNLIANTESIVNYLKISSDDTILVVLPFYYCYGLSLLHTHIRVGGSVVLNNNFILIGSVIQDIIKYSCTGFAGVPSHYQILLRKSDAFKSSIMPSMRYVTQAGGKLHTVFIKEFLESFPQLQFYTMYGQTEATARLSYLPPERLSDKLGSIGKGIPGVTLKVISENGEMVEPGVVGEIIAKGDNIMSGYFKDEEATRKAIRDGWLYTGDLAEVDEDGYIYLTARKKEMIKVGGNRVSPKEIEEAVVSIPGVIDCTIEAFAHDLLGEAIKAVVVKRDDMELTEEDVKRLCSSRLSSYKVPHRVEFVAQLQISATGKK